MSGSRSLVDFDLAFGRQVHVGGRVLERLARAERGVLGLAGDVLDAGGPGVVEERERGVDLVGVLGDDFAEHAVVQVGDVLADRAFVEVRGVDGFDQREQQALLGGLAVGVLLARGGRRVGAVAGAGGWFAGLAGVGGGLRGDVAVVATRGQGRGGQQ